MIKGVNEQLEAGPQRWSDWKWQYSNRIQTQEELQKSIQLSPPEKEALGSDCLPLPFSITPYYLKLVDPINPNQGIRRSIIPRIEETAVFESDLNDPLAEQNHEVVPGLIHRYPDRVLFLVTDNCPAYCRYCTRSRLAGKNLMEGPREKRWLAAIEYIKQNRSVRDVLISGGDPLILSDSALQWLLEQVRGISHVDIIRIGTKAPAVLPMRITPELTAMLKNYHPLFLSLHFIHPEELTEEAGRACRMLADAGIPLGSQTVLLKGVNDNVEVLTRLFRQLLTFRVRPYYLLQCDPVAGNEHFRTPIENGLEIMAGIDGFVSGYAVPAYKLDTPGGGGKIPLIPDPIHGRDGDYLIVENYRKEKYRYPDPGGQITSCGSHRDD